VLLNGQHVGDAYAACSRATEKSAHAYAMVLRLELPDDARFGVELQCEEIELDCKELRRLRWGAALSPSPAARKDADTPSEHPQTFDEQALEAWDDDGGRRAGQRPSLARPDPKHRLERAVRHL
jgi:hypothetical protein